MEERSYRFSHRNSICGDNAQLKTPSDCLNFPSAFQMDAVSKCLKTSFCILQFVPLFRGLTEGNTLLFPGLWVWAPSACHNSASLVTSAWCLSASSGEITFLLFLFILLESFTGGDSHYLDVQLTSSKGRPGSLYIGCSEHSTGLLSVCLSVTIHPSAGLLLSFKTYPFETKIMSVIDHPPRFTINMYFRRV